jgi:hypothetical protein
LKLSELSDLYSKEKREACNKGKDSKEGYDEWVNNNGLRLEELEGKLNRRMFTGSSRASIVTKTGKLCGETVSLLLSSRASIPGL